MKRTKTAIVRHCTALHLIVVMTAFFGSIPDLWASVLLSMQVGEVRVLAFPDVARVAVGDGHVINAVATDEKEVIIFARHEGVTALQIWSESGERRHYSVEVAPEGAKQIQNELRSVLERIPDARVTAVGDKLLIEGDDLSDADRERVLILRQRYPQLLDFTGQVGWDRMVLLNVQVVELPRSYLHELGVRWDTTTTGGMTAGIGWDGGSQRFDERPGEPMLPLAFPAAQAAGYFGINALLSARVDAMVKKGDAVVLAQPQLLARSGAVAEFLAGGEVPYSVVDANGNTNTAFKPYGVSLRITPQIERNDIVRSSIEVEVSSVDPTFSAPGGPSLKTRRAATEFNVRSGQTLVLAGFLSREASQNVDGVPALSQIPVLGHLFKSRRSQRNETELAIFVTPVVVSADHPDLQERVIQANSILDSAFPGQTRLNMQVRPDTKPDLPPPSALITPSDPSQVAPSSGFFSSRAEPALPWNPWESSGSQWLPAEQADPSEHAAVFHEEHDVLIKE